MTNENKSRDVALIDRLVGHNTEDIRELKNRVCKVEEKTNDLEATQRVTNQSVSHILETLTDLKNEFKAIDNKIEQDIGKVSSEIRKSNDKLHAHQIDTLQQYKNTVWAMGSSIVGSVIVAAILFALNI